MSLVQLWGNSCWYLFHTLAYKLKEEHNGLIPKILEKIMYICKNLPCPDCSEHAVMTLSRLNRHLVITKEDLIKVLLQFHNNVNKRRNVVEFTREEYNDKYNSANFDAIAINFFKVMTSRFPTNERGMANELQRRIMVNNIANFIKDNRHAFE